MPNRIYDFVMDHGKVWAFFASAIITFFIAGALFIVICFPFSAIGLVSWSSVFFGSIGCAIGNSLVISIFCAMNA